MGKDEAREKNIVRAAVTKMRIASLKIRIHVSFFGPKARGESKENKQAFSPHFAKDVEFERTYNEAGRPVIAAFPDDFRPRIICN